MAGRLDAVDLQSDVLLVALYDMGPYHVEDLLADLRDVDTDAFPFDSLYDDSDAFVDDGVMFDQLGFVTPADSGQHVELSERGQVMASILLDELSEAQWRALQDAGVCR
jgi:hypothetical protein